MEIGDWIVTTPPPASEDNCLRDLEDFTRVQIRASDNLTSLSNITYSLTLTGGGAVNFFQAVDETMKYLKDASTAQEQVVETLLVAVASGETPLDPKYIKTHNQISPFILEGARAGTGSLTIIVKQNGQELCRSSVELDLQEISTFYEKFVVPIDPNLGGDNVASSFELSPETYYHPETNEYVLQVLGWNLDEFEKDAWSATAFKRLWWLNYKGHFGSFQWPTLGETNVDRSEFRAWNSAPALSALLIAINGTYPGQVRVLAHSMGNIVTGEAIRLSPPGTVKAYIAAQASIPAHCYDNTLPTDGTTPPTPNIYGYFFSGVAPDQPYFADNHNKTSLFQYYNADDYALTTWWPINNLLKPLEFYHYRYTANHGFFQVGLWPWTPVRYLALSKNGPDDRYEIFAYCAPSWSQALGRVANVAGFKRQQNLKAFGYDDTHYSHSREFRSNIIDEGRFWLRVAKDFDLAVTSQPVSQ